MISRGCWRAGSLAKANKACMMQEATVWKMVQRILGTLIGGTLAYLIMLRTYIHTRGVAVAALCLTSIFVISQRLDSRLKYTVYLTMLTLSSLTFCQFADCCK